MCVGLSYVPSCVRVDELIARNIIFCISFKLAVFFDEHSGAGGMSKETNISVRVNGNQKATMYKQNSSTDDSTNGDLIVVKLKKGDVVDVWIFSGGIGSAADTHFTGHLLFPL